MQLCAQGSTADRNGLQMLWLRQVFRGWRRQACVIRDGKPRFLWSLVCGWRMEGHEQRLARNARPPPYEMDAIFFQWKWQMWEAVENRRQEQIRRENGLLWEAQTEYLARYGSGV